MKKAVAVISTRTKRNLSFVLPVSSATKVMCAVIFLPMTCLIFALLHHTGILPKEITILTPYAAQQRLIEDKMRHLKILSSSQITTIDNYQGEENRIIILSLVRNNDCKSVGFLRTSNRVCVALSRAKHGLFILGNIEMLSASGSLIWRHVQRF